MAGITEMFLAMAVAAGLAAAPVEETPEEAVWYDETAYYDDYGYDYGEDEYYAPSDGLNAYTGVYEHDGRVESYYSSNVLYHYRTNEWTVDDEGFYRDADGYYVVAASDMEEGETFEGSKGQCKVYDNGCSEGVTDYYVNW